MKNENNLADSEVPKQMTETIEFSALGRNRDRDRDRDRECDQCSLGSTLDSSEEPGEFIV